VEKRVFLAIFLCFIVLAVYQAMFAPPPPPPVDRSAQTQPAAPAPNPAAPAGGQTAPPVGVIPATPPAEARADVAPLVADTAARDVVVDTNDVHAVFSTEGAVLTSWQLKHYLDTVEGRIGQPLELIPQDIPKGLARPFTIATDDPKLTAKLASVFYLPSATNLILGAETGVLTFEYKDRSGLSVRKTFHIQPDRKPFVLSVDVTVDLNGATRPARLDFGPALGLGYKPDGSQSVPARVVLFRNDKVERLMPTTIVEQPHYEGALRYAGVEEQYFLSVVMPGTQSVQVDCAPITLPVPPGPGIKPGLTRNFIAYSVNVPGTASLPFFLGPKDFDVLRAVDPQLVRAIDFGIFSWLVVPLLQFLKWLNRFIGNYGWSIVALTVIINLLIFPLRHRSMVSMKKMQALQPEIKAIQERYAKYKVTDPERQKMNTEMMALYKQKGVNPVSGCFPMLLTLPILYAFYNLLSSSIELRGAPFIGWIHDLSTRDPYYITPVIMGATMFLQQQMMPSTADPVQRRIFLILPIFFTFTFLWAPSGLVLYWLLSNVLAIGQQYLTNRMIGAPVRPAPPPVAVVRKGKG
jgi:YidC/Oxa1 family membrane protein insertase